MTKQEMLTKAKQENIELSEFYENRDEEWMRESYPLCYKLIVKLDAKQKYVNFDDYQGGAWSVGVINCLRGIAVQAMNWMDSDGYNEQEMLNLCNNFNSDTLVQCINDIWQINYQKVED